MGFVEVLMNLRSIFRNLAFCKTDIRQYQPDALILVDYPGFNLRIARWAFEEGLFKKSGGKVVYYISPQVWAWKENRVIEMKKHVDKMLVILPFEKEYFRDKWNWDVEYVGHPLVEEIEKFRIKGSAFQPPSDKPVIALLPGSRKQEIEKKLPVMLTLSRDFPGYHFVVAKAPSTDDRVYTALMREYPGVTSVTDQTYDLLLRSSAALVTSGTATLETALFGVPEVVCYKGSYLSYQIGKRLVKVKYISLVNLIMDKPVVKELIQNEFTVANLKTELDAILHNEDRRRQLEKDYALLKQKLGEKGNASANAAQSIYRFLAE
jgi:lipid-A-disaccharide synthase